MNGEDSGEEFTGLDASLFQSDRFDSQRFDQRMLDVMLHEVMTGDQPPDVAGKVLSQLQHHENGSGTDIDSGSLSGIGVLDPEQVSQQLDLVTRRDLEQQFRRRTRSQRNRGLIWMITMSGVAASVAVLVTLFLVGQLDGRNVANPEEQEAAPSQQQPNPGTETQLASDLPNPTSPQRVEKENRKPRGRKAVGPQIAKTKKNQGSSEGVRMDVPDLPVVPEVELLANAGGTDAVTDPATKPTAVAEIPEREESGKIVNRINQSLVAHWKANGVRPTESVDDSIVARRLRFNLGLRVALDRKDSVTAAEIQAEMADESALRAIAKSWVDQAAPPDAGGRRKQEVTMHLVDALVAGEPLDATLASWIDGSASPEAVTAWYGLMGGGGLNPNRLVVGMSHAVMDLDAGCVRCHDALTPQSKGFSEFELRQRDFHALARVFRAGLRREEGSVTVLPELDEKRREGFFESAQGTQVVVNAALPNSFGFRNAAPSDVSLTAFADEVRQSHWLAEATVERLWRFVYTHPLVGDETDVAGVDTSHAQELRSYLADQLIANQFDLAAAASWIAAAKPMALSQPSVLEGGRFLSASDEQVGDARLQVALFAAAPVRRQEFSRDQVQRLVVDWLAPTSLQNQTLAQIEPVQIPSKSNPMASTMTPRELAEEWLRMSLPDSGESLSIEWLRRFDSYEQAAAHVSYAAGYAEHDERREQLAKMFAGLRGRSTDGAGSVFVDAEKVAVALIHFAAFPPSRMDQPSPTSFRTFRQPAGNPLVADIEIEAPLSSSDG